MADRHIVAFGGWPFADEGAERRLQDYLLGLARGTRVCLVPTAGADDPAYVVNFFERWRGRGELAHIPFFPWPPEDLREFTLGQDVIVVGGGNTANMLAIWRVHGFDQVLREAWAAGVVLTGWSAGMICWFEAGVTDSYGPQLAGMRDGLQLLAGSACPHYDGEERRRPVYARLLAEGFPPGLAADDGVGLHFAGTELAEVVSVQPGATAYRVDSSGETALEARPL